MNFILNMIDNDTIGLFERVHFIIPGFCVIFGFFLNQVANRFLFNTFWNEYNQFQPLKEIINF